MRSRTFKYVRKDKHDGDGLCLIFCPESTSDVDTGTDAPTTAGQTSTSDTAQTSGSSTIGSESITDTASVTSSSSILSGVSSSIPSSTIIPSSTSPSSTVSSTSSSSSFITDTSSSSTASAPPVSTSFIVTTSDDQVMTLTQSIIVEVASASSAADATGSSTSALSDASAAPAPVPFLQNKPLAGSVIGIGSAIALVLLVVLITMSFRKSRKNKLEREALTEQLSWPSIGDDANDVKANLSDEPKVASNPSPMAMYPLPPAQAYNAPLPPTHNPHYHTAQANGYGQQQQWAVPSAPHGGYAPQEPPGLYGGHVDPVSANSAYSGLAYDGSNFVTSPGPRNVHKTY